jgi:hypothetical protein
MNDSPRPRPARRLALLAVLAIAFAIGIFALLNEPTEVASNRTPQSEAPEVAASTARNDVELASAPVMAPSAAPKEAESVPADADSEPAAAAATLASNNRAAVSEAHGVARWSDLLAPYDAHDNTHVADARISIVLADGQLVTASLSDPVDPRALVEGNVGVLDAPNHFSRLFLPHVLAEASTARVVSLQPAATLRFVPTGDAPFLLEGAEIEIWSQFAFVGADFEPGPDHNALEGFANYGDRLIDPNLDERKRARLKKSLMRRESSLPLFDLSLPTRLGNRSRSTATIAPESRLLDLRVPAASRAVVQLSVPEGLDAIWSLSADPTKQAAEAAHVLDPVQTPAVGQTTTIGLQSRPGATVIGRFPQDAVNPRGRLTRRGSGNPTVRLTGQIDPDDGGRFELVQLEPGAYTFSSEWLESNDVFVNASTHFELTAGGRFDLGTLAAAADAKRMTIVPVLRVDGVVVTDVSCMYGVWLSSEWSVGDDGDWRDFNRADLNPFAVVGLERSSYTLGVSHVAFVGEHAEKYRWIESDHEHELVLTGDVTTVDLLIDARSADGCTVAIELPATNEDVGFSLEGWLVDVEAGNAFSVQFESNWIEGRDEPVALVSTVLVPPGDYSVFVVATSFRELIGFVPSESPSFAGRAEVSVTPGTKARVDVPLREAVTCTGSMAGIIGKNDGETHFLMHLPGMPDVYWPLWPSRPDPKAGHERFIVRGLLPHTEYEIGTYGQRFTTGAPGSTTEL